MEIQNKMATACEKIKKDASMLGDRAGGTSHGSGNPPAFDSSIDFIPHCKPQQPKSIGQLAQRVLDHGFTGSLGETEFILHHMNYETFMQYGRSISRGKAVRNVHSLFMFDQRLKSILMRWIGVFETQFRALYSNAMAMHCGTFAHRNPSNFKSIKHFEDFLENYAREMKYKIDAGSSPIRDIVENYGDVPIWTATEILPFGTLSKMFRNTKPKEVTHAVSDALGVRYDSLVSWMRTVSEVRNRCAHFSPLVCRPIVCKPKRIPGIEKAFDTSTAFYASLVIAQLTQPKDVSDDIRSHYSVGCFTDIFTELANAPKAALKIGGFPDDWDEVMAAQTKVIRELKVGSEDRVLKTVAFDI